jgi:hypothetical protein
MTVIDDKRSVKPQDGFSGWMLTVNRYGAICLNTERMMFADIDTEIDPRAPEKKVTPEKEAWERIERAISTRRDMLVRVYRTAAGLRLMCVSGPHAPNSAESLDFLYRLGCDPAFIAICRKQRCYRARLTPKPWRMLNPMPPFTSIADAEIYLAGARVAVARYIKSVGCGSPCRHPDITSGWQLHDRYCKSDSTLPLA